MNTCSSCRAAITWAKSKSGKAIPLDPEPVLNGNVELVAGAAHVVKPDPGVRRFVSHFVTCPKANSHRKPK